MTEISGQGAAKILPLEKLYRHYIQQLEISAGVTPDP